MSGFAYHKATGLANAMEQLARTDVTVQVLAGGTNVAPDIHHGSVQPALLLDITGIEELRGISEQDGKIRLGALVTLKQIAESPLLLKKAPALHQAANQFADPTTRRRATVGGNLCNASPGADSAPPLLAYDAELTIAGPSCDRTLPLDKFFAGSFRTALAPGELVKWLEFTPRPASAFLKLGHRGAMAISITTAAVAVQQAADGTLDYCHIAYGASASTPLRAYCTEQLFLGKKPSDKLFDEASRQLLEDLSPRDGLRGSKKYRQSVVGTLLRRAMLSVID